ncbi:MAG: heavy metal translocating P-type ATPase [Phycisphaerae bacterium]
MTCGACVHRVENALRGVDGVEDAIVNLMSESAMILAGDVPRASLVEAVRAAGYDAEPIAAGRDWIDRHTADNEFKETMRRHHQALVQAIGLAVPIVGLEYAMPFLFGVTEAHRIGGRLLQILLLGMLVRSPAGAPILAGGLRALWHRTGNMELLVSMGVFVAFASSLYGIFIARRHEFIHLHAAAMILALVCVGRTLEARARGRASAAMSALARRAPNQARVRREGAWISTPVEKIRAGDTLSIPAHEPVPVDGEVIEGRASVDESLMTGEPMPLTRSEGDAVLGGSIVIDGMLIVRATTTGARSALGRIMELVQQAQSSRTRMQRLADRVSAIFTPVVIMIAALVFLAWWAFGESHGTSRAARAAVAVLVVACPCALGLATPTVVRVASGLAALRGILVRDAATLEAMGQVRVVVWDKTGTLTGGRPRVNSVERMGEHGEQAVRLAASAEQFSNHPLAEAIVSHARRHGTALSVPTSFESVPGAGVKATIDGHEVIVGRPLFLRECGIPIDVSADSRDASETRVGVAVDGKAAGLFRFTDSVRPSTLEALARLRRMGIQNEMLTGDAGPVALSIAARIGIERSAIHFDATPLEKAKQIASMRGDSTSPRVAMVGDGVNDAAALAEADVGIAFAAGAPLACEAADIQLIGSTPHLVADAVELARASVRVIRQNLFWAFFYNLLMIPLAATGRLSPAIAAGAMMLSSLTVVLNALRLPRVARMGESIRA